MHRSRFEAVIGRNQLLARASVVWAIATATFIALACYYVPPERVGYDFLAFWTGASLVSQGLNPYDPALQSAIQSALGWRLETDGLGVYEFLPYLYPPWFAFLFVPLLPLGFSLAKLAWMVLSIEMMLAAAVVTALTSRKIGVLSAILVVLLYGQGTRAVWLGQPSSLLFLLAALTWWCLSHRRDATAGALLALLTIKPHITIFLIATLLGWAAIRGRWRLPLGFAATLAGILVTTTVLLPGWSVAMFNAPQATPVSTVVLPGFGVTWAVALAAVGVEGLALGLSWALVALPFLLLLVHLAVSKRTDVEDVFCGSLIAPFFVAPYAHAYDLSILLLPLLILAGGRLPTAGGAILLFAMTFLLDVHIVRLASWLAESGIAVGKTHPEFTFLWAPLLVALAWLYAMAKRQAGQVSD